MTNRPVVTVDEEGVTFGSAQRSGLIEPSSGSLSNLVLRSAGSIDEANTAGVRVGEIKVVEVGEGQTDATLDGCRRRQSRAQGSLLDTSDAAEGAVRVALGGRRIRT